MFFVGARDRKNGHVGFVFKLRCRKVTGQICNRQQIWRWLARVKDTGWLRGKLECMWDEVREMWKGVRW